MQLLLPRRLLALLGALVARVLELRAERHHLLLRLAQSLLLLRESRRLNLRAQRHARRRRAAAHRARRRLGGARVHRETRSRRLRDHRRRVGGGAGGGGGLGLGLRVRLQSRLRAGVGGALELKVTRRLLVLGSLDAQLQLGLLGAALGGGALRSLLRQTLLRRLEFGT